ncbi:MAG: M20/M25/M40 family metallo-hydrolase [Candidatus Hodarchaeales archaeon]|jgi:succinyl-diaminopimelate desuccinylase
MDPVKFLDTLIQFNTINNPSKNIIPNPSILHFIVQKVKEWNSNFEALFFEDQGYSSVLLGLNPKEKVHVLFMGHLDVVPVSHGWLSDPFILKVESGMGYGRGAKDCKGSVVSTLLMLDKLCRQQNSLQNNLGFYFSLDEETGGRHGAKIFFDYAKKHEILPRFVINVDGGPQVVNKRRGGFGVTLKIPPKLREKHGFLKSQKCHTHVLADDNRHSAYFVPGSDSHALIALSKYLYLHNLDWKVVSVDGPWIKGNVIPNYVDAKIIVTSNAPDAKLMTYDENLTRIIRKLRSLILIELPSEIQSEFGITVNPNIINYSADQGTEIYCDVRIFLSPQKSKILINSFKQRLDNLSEETTVTCSGSTGYFNTPQDSLLVRIAVDELSKFNLIKSAREQEGASDARYAFAHNIPVIDLGPKGGKIHGANEFIELDSMMEFAAIYEEIANRLVTPGSRHQ